jgi:two-component system, OmpR family, phosphate regulon sensor histidine kinase PhoR
MKKSIFFKIFSGFLVLILVFSTAVLFFTFDRIRSFYIDSIAQELQTLGTAVKTDIIELWRQQRPEQLDEYFKRLGRQIDTRITLVNEQGRVLADSDEDPEVMEDHKFRPEIIRAFGGEPGQSIRFSKTVQRDMLYVGLPIRQNGEVVAVLRMSRYFHGINILLSSLRKRLLRFVFIVFVLSIIAALVMTRSFTRPLEKLSQAARRIGSGDFDARVLIKNPGELQELAQSFNYMSEQIKNLFQEISHKKDEMTSILLSIEEGLLVIDKNGRIILSNQSFQELSKIKVETGKYYWEVVREPQFSEMIETASKMKKRYTQELEFNNKNYLCGINFLQMRDEMVITFHDITPMKHIEEIKRDFVINVSHELRTPLTAIKGFLETLEEEVEGRPFDYVQTIKRNTERLIHIVRDLLILSEVEDKAKLFKKEEFDPGKLIQDVVKIFEARIEEKNLNIAVCIESELPHIFADPFMLEQVVINLLDNAVKYTASGQITIELKQSGGKLILSIQDTGVGIPKPDLKRIFERFYVVDKSRTRSLGGTGLGLSIVKHIIQLHEGRIDVESTPGIGTSFVITLPFA